MHIVVLIIFTIFSSILIFHSIYLNLTKTKPNPLPIQITPNVAFGVSADNMYGFENWTNISSSYGMTSITLNDGYIYGIVNSDIIYTVPGSSTYVKLDNNNNNIIAIAFDFNKSLFGLSSDGKLYTKWNSYNSHWIMYSDLSIAGAAIAVTKFSSFCFDVTYNILYCIANGKLYKLLDNVFVYITDTNLLTIHNVKDSNIQTFYGVTKDGVPSYSTDLINWETIAPSLVLYDITISS